MYIYTSVLLCIDMHRVSGTTCQVGPIVMLIWSKVCITKTITKKLSQFLSKSYRQLSITLSKSYHLWKLVRFVENWPELWKTDQICGQLIRFVGNLPDL